MMNLYDLFRETACRQPDAPAILDSQENLSYRQLAERIDDAGAQLARSGVGPGTHVGLHVPSGLDYIILTYGVWRCGGCVVPIPVELTAREKQEICREIALDQVIAPGRTASFLEPFRAGGSAPLSPGSGVFPVTGSEERPAGVQAINGALIRFTSGTTGASKGVVLSHETIRDRIHAANEVLHLGPGDRVVWLLSMSYHFAVSIVGYLSFGAAIILPPDPFAQAIIGAARTHRGTVIYGSPAHYAWMAACEPFIPLPDLRLVISTTTALDRRTAREFHERFGLPVVQALGIIEVGLPFINTDFASDRCAAVGRVLPAYRLRLEDVGLGPDFKEVLLAGKGFLDAYYRPWRTRREIMPDGWFRTGDVGALDGDGCLFLHGRTKDVISVLGMKFFPREVEAVLESHPAVRAACVTARPDDRLGEVPHAQVMVRAGAQGSCSEADLLAHCRRQLASFKVPVRVEFVDALPRTASGKVLHRVLRQPTEADHDLRKAA
jgi:long-chain acyl-CoA synthetase